MTKHETIIYKIACNDLNITDLYIGHTSEFKRRQYEHKCCCTCLRALSHNFSSGGGSL